MKKQTEFNILLKNKTKLPRRLYLKAMSLEKSLHDLAQAKIPERSDSIVVYKTGKMWGVYQMAEYKDGGEREHKMGCSYRSKELAVDFAHWMAKRLGMKESRVLIVE